MKNDELVGFAIKAMQQAYSPYSNYPVGAALLTEDDIVVPGCNVENASYGLTICAERTAFAAAVSSGARNFKAIAIVTDSGNMPYPCGACLQVMSEFCTEDFLIITALAAARDAAEVNTLGSLLKTPFKIQSRKEKE